MRWSFLSQPASDDQGTQRPSPSSRSASSTISRTTPAGLESRASGARRSTSGSARASSHAPPRRHVTKSCRVSSCSVKLPGRRRRVGRRRVPEAHGAREREDQRDVRRVAPEARAELLHERLGRAHAGAHVGESARLGAPLVTRLVVSRAATAMPSASGAGSSEKRARRGAWSPEATKVAHLLAARLALAVVAAPMIALTSVGTT